jgi:hypothetical protein
MSAPNVLYYRNNPETLQHPIGPETVELAHRPPSIRTVATTWYSNTLRARCSRHESLICPVRDTGNDWQHWLPTMQKTEMPAKTAEIASVHLWFAGSPMQLKDS